MSRNEQCKTMASIGNHLQFRKTCCHSSGLTGVSYLSADVMVASPVEDFFLMIDGLPAASKLEAEKLTGTSSPVSACIAAFVCGTQNET